MYGSHSNSPCLQFQLQAQPSWASLIHVSFADHYKLILGPHLTQGHDHPKPPFIISLQAISHNPIHWQSINTPKYNSISTKIWGTHNGVVEGTSCLGCGAVTGCKVPPASKDCSAFILQHSKKKHTFLLGMLDPEDEDTIILQNMENYSLNDKASQHRQLASSLLHQYHTKYLWHNIILVHQNKTLGSQRYPYPILGCFLLGFSITSVSIWRYTSPPTSGY